MSDWRELETSGRLLCGKCGVPTETQFRAIGFTAAAAHFPLSNRAFLWRCNFNGIKPAAAPTSWRYAPNVYMQTWLDRVAEQAGY